MTSTIHCHTCGRLLADDELDGLCASCIMTFALGEPGGTGLQAIPAFSLNIPGYEIHQEIARGGMGIVYRAGQLEPQREVALKMLLPYQASSPAMLERFRLEARAIATLEHPAILPVYHVGEHNGLPFFTMKLASGGTLAQRKVRFSGNWRSIAEILATVADAVHFAHDRGVLHRDLKPGNVLFDAAGRVYVSDFGLAKLINSDTDFTSSIEFLGTPNYVAPEVASHSTRQATTASDVYSLGAILYELLAGRSPFQAQGVPALLKKITEEEPAPPSAVYRNGDRTPGPATVPRDLEVICLKCLAKQPASRYGSARELAEDLRRWLTGQAILARTATRLERLQSWVRRNPALAALSALLASVLLVAVIWEARSNRRLHFALGESLLRQGRLERTSGRPGQRYETMSLISRAIEEVGLARIPQSNIVALRTETAAALALPDVCRTERWPVHVSHQENSFNFTADLRQYVGAAPDGGFTVFSRPDNKPLRHIAGDTKNPAVQLQLSPDGHWVAAQFQDGHAELISVADNKPSPRWAGEPNARAVFTFSSSSKLFAAIAHATGKPDIAEIIDLHTGGIGRVPARFGSALAFDASETRLAAAGAELVVWKFAPTNRLWSAMLTHEVSALAWSPDGRRIAAALDRRSLAESDKRNAGYIALFDAEDGRLEFIFDGPGSRVVRLAFHSDGQWIGAATQLKGMMLAALQPEGMRLFFESTFRALQFSRDRIGFSPTKEELGIAEVAIPRVFRAWQEQSAPSENAYGAALSSDARWLVTVTRETVCLWDVEQHREVDSRPLPVKAWWAAVLFGPENKFIYCGADAFGVRKISLVQTNSPEGRSSLRFGTEELLGEPGHFMVLSLSNDGRSPLVGQYHGRMPSDRIPPTVWLWPNGDPRQARKVAEGFPLVGYRAVPKSRWGVTTDLIEPDLWIWDLEKGERIRSLGISSQVASEMTSNGRWIVSRTRHEFAVWEVGDWRRLSRWPTRPDEQRVGTLVASPDSRLLATSGAEGRFILRSLPSGSEIIILPPPRPMQVADWLFHPDATRLIVLLQNGRIVEWDLAEIRRELAKLGLDWKNS